MNKGPNLKIISSEEATSCPLVEEGPVPPFLLIKECEGSLDFQGLPLHHSCVLAKDRDEARWPSEDLANSEYLEKPSIPTDSVLG